MVFQKHTKWLANFSQVRSLADKSGNTLPNRAGHDSYEESQMG